MLLFRNDRSRQCLQHFRLKIELNQKPTTGAPRPTSYNLRYITHSSLDRDRLSRLIETVPYLALQRRTGRNQYSHRWYKNATLMEEATQFKAWRASQVEHHECGKHTRCCMHDKALQAWIVLTTWSDGSISRHPDSPEYCKMAVKLESLTHG